MEHTAKITVPIFRVEHVENVWTDLNVATVVLHPASCYDRLTDCGRIGKLLLEMESKRLYRFRARRFAPVGIDTSLQSR